MSSSSVPGTNVPPITFPGIVSGIDYNTIIQKLTSLTLAPTTGLNAQIATLNSANAELAHINQMLLAVQDSLATLSDPSIFSSFDAVSSNTNVATAQGLPSATALAGTYVIEGDQIATATSVQSSTSVAHKETDAITSGPFTGQPSDTVPLADSYAAVTPSNGSGSSGQGTVTIDGVQIQYNVNTESIDQIFTAINNALTTTANGGPVDAGFHIGFEPGTDTVEITGTKPITLGSATDQGNLLQVLKLDQSQVNNVGATTSVIGQSGVGGLNATEPLDTGNDANLKTPITSGFFTINGQQINVDATGDNIYSILQKINSSNAGVTATYSAETNRISLTSTSTGPQSIVIGSPSDTSNFLAAVGLTTASGATTTVGQQASVTVQAPNGTTQTVFSNTNTVTDAIPGIQLNLTSNDPLSSNNPFTVTVSQNTSGLVSAINMFVSAYNAAVNEINTSTAPPVVAAVAPGQINTNGSSQLAPGGVLYGNADIMSVKNELMNIVSGFLGSQQAGDFGSLTQIGLQLDSSFSTITTANNSSSGEGNGSNSSSGQTGPVQSTTLGGTDGLLQPLNSQQLLSVLQSNPNAVQDLINGTNGLTNVLGSYLTSVTGSPTLLSGGPVGNIPTIPTMTAFEHSNNDSIQSLQAQVSQITDNANSQANNLRAEFVSSETMIAGLQAEQQELAAALGFTVSSSGTGH